jgi:predicted DNA-binding transcriptional regulator AlpA
MDEQFLPASKVRERYQITDVTIWRWMQNPNVKFPRPALNPSSRFRLWRLSDIEAWEKSHAEQVEA